MAPAHKTSTSLKTLHKAIGDRSASFAKKAAQAVRHSDAKSFSMEEEEFKEMV